MIVTHEDNEVMEITFGAAPYADSKSCTATYRKIAKRNVPFNFDFGWNGWEFFTDLSTNEHYCRIKL